MLRVDNFTSLLQVETAYEAFVYELGIPNQEPKDLLSHLNQYRFEIDRFARKYAVVDSYFPLPELEARKGLLNALRELLKSNRATNDEILIHFRKLPDVVQNEYRNLASLVGIKNLDTNLRKILQLKELPTDKAPLIDKQIEWLTHEIAKYKTQEFVFKELAILKPKIGNLIKEVKSRISASPSLMEQLSLGDTDINDLWWEQRSTYESIFQQMKANLAAQVFKDRITPHGGLLNNRIVYIDNKTKAINAHFAFNGKYIQTACPREYTVIDFYKMIQEHSCQSVVMLNGLYEYSHFIPYWPTELRVPRYFGQTEVVLIDHTETFVHSQGHASKDRYLKPSISSRVVRISSPGYPPRQITLFQYHSWGDGKKGDEACVNKLIDMIDQSHQGKKGPTVIHCGAGMGRTGTFTAIFKLAHDLKEGKRDLKVKDAVMYQRNVETGRGGGMVNEEQYLFCHSALQHRLLSTMYI